MKKLIIACLASAALVSLSACSTAYETTPTGPSMVDSGPQSLVSSPGDPRFTVPADNPPPRPAFRLEKGMAVMNFTTESTPDAKKGIWHLRVLHGD